MAQYSESVLQELRSRVDIVDLIGQYVQLRRAGVNHKGLCPFHREKTPSFHVHPEKQIYRCFGCGASGTIFNFLMQHEGLSFPEAVRHLAERAGLTLEDKGGPAGPSRQLTERLRQIQKAAAALYARMLLEQRDGDEARRYLSGRGLDLEMARELGLGYAPESWDFTRNALQKQGFELVELEQAGLIKRADNQPDRLYDRFRHRLMFPIADPYGAVIAFGGRTLGDDAAKYINSPESPIYHKGRQLFGLHLAREAIKETGFAVLVEGNFDVVLPWSRGVRNVVAPLGTSLTPEHARLLKRYTDSAVLLFDQDEAGQTTQRRAAELLLSENCEVRIATLDKHKDPADYVQLEGADALRRRLEAAEQAVVFYARRAAEQLGEPTPRNRARAVASVLPLVEKVRDPIERAESLGYVAAQLEVDERLVRQELDVRTPRGAGARGAAEPAAPAAPPEPMDDIERSLLRALLVRPGLLVQYLEQRDPAELRSVQARELIGALSALHSDLRPLALSELLDRIESEPLRRQVAQWVFEADGIDVEAEFHGCLHEMNRRRLEHDSAELARRLREAERAGNEALVAQLGLQLLLLAQEKRQESEQRATLLPAQLKSVRNRLK